jgi:hypothetical protein
MNIPAFFTTIYLSFFSRKLYQEVCANWQKLALKYLLWLVILNLFPLTVTSFNYINSINLGDNELDEIGEEITVKENDLSRSIKDIINQIPIITIKNGIVSINEQQPYYIYYPTTKKIFAIIDTTNSKESRNVEAFIVLTKDSLKLEFNKNQKVEYKIVNLTEPNKNLIIDQHLLKEWIQRTKERLEWFIPFVMFPSLVIFMFLTNLFRAVLFTLVGGIGVKLLKYDINYQALFRLAVVAASPAIVAETIFTILPGVISIPTQQLIIFILKIFYFGFAISSCCAEKNNNIIK